MPINQRFLHCVLTLSIVFSLAITNYAFPSKRSRPVKRTPVRIVLDKSELQLGPNQTVEVKAKVLDAHDKQIPNARIAWKVIEGAENSVVIQPVNKTQTDVLIKRTGGVSRGVATKIQADSGAATTAVTLNLQNPAPSEIFFPDGNSINLLPEGKKPSKSM